MCRNKASCLCIVHLLVPLVCERSCVFFFKNGRDCNSASFDEAIHVGPAGREGFDERWSIIPKAHAEPAPRRPAKLSRIHTRNLHSEESRQVVRKIAQPLDHSTEFFPERPHTIRIGQEKQRAVPRSIRICQPQPTAACRSAREFASPILRPASR